MVRQQFWFLYQNDINWPVTPWMQLFFTAIWHRGLRNCFFFFTSHLLFPYSFWTFIPLSSLWTFISLFYLDFLFQFFKLVLNSSKLVSTRFNSSQLVSTRLNLSKLVLNSFYSIAVTFWISSKFFFDICQPSHF